MQYVVDNVLGSPGDRCAGWLRVLRAQRVHRIISLSTVVASRVTVVCCWLQWCYFALVLHVQLRVKSMSRSDVMVTLLYARTP